MGELDLVTVVDCGTLLYQTELPRLVGVDWS